MRIRVNLSTVQRREHFVKVLPVGTLLIEDVSVELVGQPLLGREPQDRRRDQTGALGDNARQAQEADMASIGRE